MRRERFLSSFNLSIFQRGRILDRYGNRVPGPFRSKARGQAVSSLNRQSIAAQGAPTEGVSVKSAPFVLLPKTYPRQAGELCCGLHPGPLQPRGWAFRGGPWQGIVALSGGCDVKIPRRAGRKRRKSHHRK
jgi:hypothetical protein